MKLPTPSLPPHLASLRNSILHDASHVGNRKVDVLLPEVLFEAAVVMVVQTLLCIVCTKQTHVESALSSNLTLPLVFCTSARFLTILRLEDVVTGRHVLSGDAQLGGVGGRAVSVHLQHKHVSL